MPSRDAERVKSPSPATIQKQSFTLLGRLFLTSEDRQRKQSRDTETKYRVAVQDTMSIRRHTHAGSWYSDHGPTLEAQLDQWLDLVPGKLEGLGKLPVPGARVIIAP